MTTKTNGRFQPGNQAAVGHSDQLQKLRDAVTPEDIKAVVTKLVGMARAGNLEAMALLFSVVDNPTDAPPADTSDVTR